MNNISFRNKILTLTLTIIIIFTLAIIATISNNFNWVLKDLIFENEKNNLAQKSELISHWFDDKKTELDIYASTQIVQRGSKNEKLAYLSSEINKRENNYFFFLIADENGNYTTTNNDQGSIRERNYFNQVLKGKTVISDPLISKSTGEAVIVIASPIETAANLSLLAATIKISDLSTYINRYTNNEEGIYSFIINQQGIVVAHPEKKIFKNQKLQNQKVLFDNQYAFLDQIKSQNSGQISFRDQNNEKHAFYQPISGTNGWKVVSILPQSYLKRSVNKVNKMIIIISIVTIIIAVILSLYLSNNIAQPIIKLKNTFQKGASGNLNIRSDIDSDDEIGEAAHSFNKMMDVIKDLSYNDALTGLPNISYFKQELAKFLAENQNKKVYLCAVGIDDFKSINDGFGHNIGNQVLKKLAERLADTLQQKQLISRVGDEFYFYLTADSSNFNIEKKLDKIMARINNDYFVQKNIVYIRSSLGIAVYPDDGHNVEKLLKNASLAMHSVKKSSADKIAFYTINLDNNIFEKKKLENELKEALEKEQFRLHYQSFVGRENKEILGFEALIRWEHPEKGLIPPGLFIPLAEENGFIQEIGDWVLKEACREIKYLNNHFKSDYYLSVNVSPEQFINRDFIVKLKSILSQTEFEAEKLELEITERTTVENIDYTIAALKRLKKMGIQTAIDDFGTGYSSLSYIKEFALNTLKIDKSFIDDFIDNANNRAIVNTIITLAHSLNLRVVAEGVETKEQAEKLNEYNCEILQGYYYSHPEPLEKIISNLQK